ncbi:MAG: phosphatidate cytidylyltransferase [Candidatus Pelagibacter bacterium]|jgi:phosphatidate cytidylyltransferase|nr:phosphatidate cytidylyltransferase [Candidatus Pelagibacter bacterium]|tara:strand:- start:165 stop:827 length:663 start_codon:yes stop_codon:yes gene_type:complete
MKKVLLYRILTSIVLFLSVYIMFIDSFFLRLFLFIIFVVSYYEFYKLIYLIKKNLKLSYLNFIIYNIISFSYLLFFSLIVYIYLIQITSDQALILFILLTCILTDIGGMIFGKLIGGKKLTKISPNKTISGSIGALIFSFVGMLIYINFNKNYSLLTLIILVSTTCSFSQIGDLIISYLKRKAKVKDTGKILPGHGGLLDRIDGILLGLPLGIIIFSLIK